MRKKLLALLMCATMVLGTGVTAFADSYDDADKVLTSWKGFANEYADSEAKITVSVGSSKYAFTTADHKNGVLNLEAGDYVKVNSDTKELLYVGDAVDLTAYGTITDYSKTPSTGTFDVSSDGVVTPTGDDDTNLSIVLAAYAAVTKDGKAAKDVKDYINTQKSAYSAYTLSDLGITTDGVIVKVKDDLGTHVAWLKADKDAAITAAIEWSVGEGNLTSGKVAGKTAYKTADGYSFTEFSGKNKNSFFTAIKATSDSTYSYAYKLVKITSDDADYTTLANSVAVALNSGALSTDARAARVTLYQYGVSDSTPFLNVVNKPSTAVSIPVANDLLSQTALKAATLDAYCISSTVDYDKDLATPYNVLSPLDSSLDASAAYKTFSLPLGYTYGTDGLVVIFDKSADESQNDGVASETTTTAASQTAASSPKTGDVAPIAALAVVMMGACGAMVVASKKRA
jgi:hypothetical protein